ncbi:phage tail tape measure protein [uncultured Anaerococcus sp.]|uniref:phage tail tape measure protein n=1 Tax=uncultured Anaerococcus sp. TaxID=293428 RepID=UPI0025D0EA22|nr:phage tail tape measure protein [uncultured Anaerococcus sp.]
MASRELILGIRTKDASKASKDIKDIDKSIKGAEKSTKGFGKAADGAKKSLFNLAGAGKGLKELGGKFDALGGKVKRFGTGLSKATLPLMAVIAGGSKMFLDLDNSIRKVSTLSGEILPVEKIREETRRISDMSGIASKEVAESMYSALSASVDPSKVVGFTEDTIKFAKAGFTELPTAIDVTTTALNAYGDKAESVSKIHDILVKSQNLGKTTVDELASSIGNVIPVAAANEVGMDQLGVAYSLLTYQGINAHKSTTGLNSLLAELSTTGSKADKVLRQKTGKSFKGLMGDGRSLGDVLGILDEQAKASGLSMQDMFGNFNAGKIALSLANDGVEKYNKTLKEMQNSDGITEFNFEKMLGPGERLARVSNKIKNNLIDLGAEAVPYLEILGEKIGELSDWFAGLDKGTKDTIVQWGLLLVAAGPLIAIFGTILGVVGKLVTIGGFLLQGVGLLASTAGILGQGFMFIVSCTNPLMWIFIAIGGVITWLITHFQTIKARADELGGGFGWLRAIVETAGASFTNMGNLALGALNRVRDKWQEVKNFLKNPIKGVISIFSNVVNRVKGAFGGAKSHATGLDYVPYDNYLANLHKGEIVLTAKASEEYRAMGGDKDGLPNRVINNNSTTNTTSNTSNVTNNNPSYPPINIYVYGNSSPTDTASEVKGVIEDVFRNLNLQRG